MKSDGLKDKLQKAYQSMVDTIELLVKKEGKTLREALENAEEKLSEWEELTKEEVHEVSTEVKHDLQAIGETLEGAKQAYKKQLMLDTTYVTDTIVEKLSKIANTPTAQFLLFKEQLKEQAQQAVTNGHIHEHNDHQRWHSDHKFWLDEIAIWKQDHEKALLKLHDIENALKKHSDELDEHAQVIQAHEAQDHEHEVAISNAEKDPSDQVFEEAENHEEKIHDQENSIHRKHAQFHEHMKKHHLHMMALVNKLYQQTVKEG